MVLKKKNPVIEKARQESYSEGFKKGTHFGYEQGKYSAVMALADKFDGLDQVPGIGPKLMEKIVKHFGSEYFEKVDE